LVDVLLTHSYHLYYDPKQVQKMQPYPPLGTLYAAALLRAQGYSVAVFDSMLENPERGFPAAIARHKPRVVAIYEDNFNYLSKMCLSRMREVAFGMIDAARATGAKVVVNGSDASDHVEEYLRRGADFVLLGEAEWTLLELMNSPLGSSKQKPKEILGLAFVCSPGEGVARTPSRVLVRDLDILPDPARDLIDMERYRKAWKAAHGFFSMNIVASRGCPYRCNWCAKPIYGDSFHSRSPQSVALEMRTLKKVYQADHLWFADDIFGLKNEWVLELAENVNRHDARVPFKMQSRVDLMKETTVEALHRAGCAEVWMGVESGSQKILDSMDKGTRVSQVLVARENLRRAGIRACYFLQFGYAGEDWADIQKTIHLVRQTRPDDIGVSVSYPLPGTKFFELVREQFSEKTNWVDSGDLSMMFKGAYTSEFYRALHDALHAEVEIWSSLQPWQSGRNRSHGVDSRLASLRAKELWAKVEDLEKTCRNSEPTLLPLDACAVLESR
jgi:anaerobic magnesium-protoporphyrin IX monomethyl ester cyclase